MNHSSVSSLAFAADGTLFVGGGNVPTSKLPYYGAGLYALDGKTGATKWFFATNDSVSGGPAISADGGSVVFGNDDSELYPGDGVAGFVYAADTATGEELWRFKTSGPYGSVSAPVISPLDGTIFAGAADGNLYALDGASGALRWTYSTTNGTSTSASGKLYSPALSVDGSLVYVTCNSGAVHAVGSADGQLRWSHATEADATHGLQSSPTVHPTNGLVYISGDDMSVHAYDATSGEERWRQQTYQYLNTSPLLSPDGKVVYVGEHYSIGDRLYALNALTGATIWQYREGSTYAYPLATLTDGGLLAAWGNGRLYAFPANATNPDDQSGQWHGNEVVWQVPLGADFATESAAVHTDGTFAVALTNGKVAALQLAV